VAASSAAASTSRDRARTAATGNRRFVFRGLPTGAAVSPHHLASNPEMGPLRRTLRDQLSSKARRTLPPFGAAASAIGWLLGLRPEEIVLRVGSNHRVCCRVRSSRLAGKRIRAWKR
jgi:hypothetical protein